MKVVIPKNAKLSEIIELLNTIGVNVNQNPPEPEVQDWTKKYKHWITTGEKS